MTECNVSACPEHWRCDQIHEATCCATYRLERKKREKLYNEAMRVKAVYYKQRRASAVLEDPR
jgi:hypothetical protein